MKKEILQVLLRLLQIGIQPVTEAGAAHKWSKQGNIAIMSSIAAPGKKSICNRGKGSNQQQCSQVAMCKGNKERDKDGHSRSNDNNTTPLLEEATSR